MRANKAVSYAANEKNKSYHRRQQILQNLNQLKPPSTKKTTVILISNKVCHGLFICFCVFFKMFNMIVVVPLTSSEPKDTSARDEALYALGKGLFQSFIQYSKFFLKF